MQIESIKSALRNHKGQNIKAVWAKHLKTRKGVESIVEKITSIVIRAGIDYENLAVVKEGRANGSMPEVSAGLPWGEWAEFPFHIAHKGTDYVRFYPTSGSAKAQSQYLLDGKPVAKEDVIALCLASEFSKPSDEAPTCFTVKADNVQSVG